MDSPYHKTLQGKTPPPAPSAVYAKRARELQIEERARYRPPALREQEPEPLPPPTIHEPAFRRARAGTLPSNVQLAAQRYASTLHNTPTPPAPDYPRSTQAPSAPAPVPAPAVNVASADPSPARPTLRHASTTVSRLRSGSLTLPSQGPSNPFGPSIFSSNWLSSSRQTNRDSFTSILDDLRSNDSGDGDFDASVHTLDYLGLAEPAPRPPPATVSELRTQAQAAIAGRLRASTVSNPYRARGSVAATLAAPPPDDANDEQEGIDEAGNYPGDYSGSGGYFNPSGATYVAKGFKHGQHLGANLTNRPRAISVGNLDDPTRSSAHRRAAEGASAQQSGYAEYDSLAPPGSLQSRQAMGNSQGPQQPQRGGGSPGVRYANGSDARGQGSYLSAQGSGAGGRVSPKGEAQNLQTPSRSLWIGNLDSSMTSEALIHVFAPYGAIESLRLLPEKECGFVNFVDVNDATRAKEDVLNRLGGHIGMANGQAVRIGYGKADSAPVAPSKTPLATPVGNVTSAPTQNGTSNPLGPSALGAGVAGAPGTLNGVHGGLNSAPGAQAVSPGGDQLQSSPTRALWIGSIPSTTTPATILSVFSPFGPIESARVLTHKNCGFINFERLDDAVRARKALNGRDVLGSDVGAIRIGFARVPVKSSNGTPGAAGGNGGPDGIGPDEIAPATVSTGLTVQGVGDLTVGATIHALRSVKGAATIPADQQVLGGNVENYRSNLLLSMIASGAHTVGGSGATGGASTGLGIGLGPNDKPGWTPSVTEQQMILKELSRGDPEAEADIQALAEFRPPTMYYTTIPLVSERPHNRRWDASKLRELRKRLDTGAMTVEDIDGVAADFLDGEIVDLASDWLGNTVVQKLFEKCSPGPRIAMLERIAPHLAMIGIHKNGTWAAQKIIECSSTPEELGLIAQNLRAYTPPLLLDQFGNYVVQCCLRFGAPNSDFIFDAMIDRLWEVAQGRFGARSMRACLESPHVTINQQRRLATAVVLNSIPLATNPNGALLLTWLLDTSNFPSRYSLLAPRFTPHLSHLCTHKLASLTVLRIVNQKVEPEASTQIVNALFFSSGDHVLTDVLGDQVNGVAVIHKILTSPFIDPTARIEFQEATKRVLIELKVIATQAYRRLIEEVGLPVPNFQPSYAPGIPQAGGPAVQPKGGKPSPPHPSPFGMPTMAQPSYQPNEQSGLVSMMAALQMGGGSGAPGVNNNIIGGAGSGLGMAGIQHQQAGPPQLHINPTYGGQNSANTAGIRNSNRNIGGSPGTFSPTSDPFNPFSLRSPDVSPRPIARRQGSGPGSQPQPQQQPSQQGMNLPMHYSPQQHAPSLGQAGSGLMGMQSPPAQYGPPQGNVPHPQMYPAYMYPMYPNQNVGAFHT